MADLAVVILNYNSGDVLRGCLDSLAGVDFAGRLDVWVVDNASADGSAAMVAANYPWVRLLVNQCNGGYAQGNNLALRRILGIATQQDTIAWEAGQPAPQSAPDYVMLLNPDTVLTPGALQTLVDYMEQHLDVGVVGPKLLLADGSLDQACRRFFPTPAAAFYRMVGLSKLFAKNPRFARYNPTYLDPDQEVDVDSVVGAAMLVRASVAREVGLLDEAFFMYGEDLDWAYRIKSYGWRVVYVPAAVIYHYKRVSSSRRPFPSIRAFYDAMRIFHRKHFAATTTAPLNWLIELGITLKEWQSLLRNMLRPPTRRRVD